MVLYSLDILESGASNLNVRGKLESQTHFLGRLSHLHLQNKNLENIDDLCPLYTLKVLYLYDNKITKIENFEQMTNLTHLYLQRNLIPRIENLRPLSKLIKLCLGRNDISVVENLETLVCLEELYLESQRLEIGHSLSFNPRSMAAVKNTLRVLNVSGNNLLTISAFVILEKLEILFINRNMLEDLQELSLAIINWKDLRILRADENPLARMRNYREIVIGSSCILEMLDEKEISKVTLTALQGFMNARNKRLVAQATREQEEIEQYKTESDSDSDLERQRESTGFIPSLEQPSSCSSATGSTTSESEIKLTTQQLLRKYSRRKYGVKRHRVPIAKIWDEEIPESCNMSLDTNPTPPPSPIDYAPIIPQRRVITPPPPPTEENSSEEELFPFDMRQANNLTPPPSPADSLLPPEPEDDNDDDDDDDDPGYEFIPY